MFYPESGGIAGQPAVCAYDPVARDDDGYRVDVTRLCHRAACRGALWHGLSPSSLPWLRRVSSAALPIPPVGILSPRVPAAGRIRSAVPRNKRLSGAGIRRLSRLPFALGQGRAGAPVQPCNLASTHCHRYWAGGSDVADCDVIIVIHACKVKILFPKFDVVVLFMKFKLINFAT